MANIKKTVLFNNLVLRDGHQSLAATRMTTAQMLPIVTKLDDLGFNYLETWGGATIDSSLRYLKENPFERLRALKKKAYKTPHMMLLRGQNLVQYTNYPDDVVEAFIECAAKAGVDAFRIFDALNDTRNLIVPIRAAKAHGKHVQGTVCYTTSPLHSLDSLAKVGFVLEEMGCDSLCIKDMAGLITPTAAHTLIKKLKANIRIPITLHSHNTAGLAVASYYAAVEAGVDALDVSIAPFANGTAQPDTLLMQQALSGHERSPNFSVKELGEIQDYLTTIYADLSAFTSPANERIDGDILRYQVPGGMMSNFRTQLKEQNMEHRLSEVMEEVTVVRKALGYIPLVTPTSQIVGTQAMLNVKFGRFAMLAQPTIDVILGKYGKTPGPVDEALQQKVIADTGEKAIIGRPADNMPPKIKELQEELKAKSLPSDLETVVLYAMFPQQTEALYLQSNNANGTGNNNISEPQKQSNKDVIVISKQKLAITLNNRRHEVLVEEIEG